MIPALTEFDRVSDRTGRHQFNPGEHVVNINLIANAADGLRCAQEPTVQTEDQYAALSRCLLPGGVERVHRATHPKRASIMLLIKRRLQ